jgi:hypothetical protein
MAIYILAALVLAYALAMWWFSWRPLDDSQAALRSVGRLRNWPNGKTAPHAAEP